MPMPPRPLPAITRSESTAAKRRRFDDGDGPLGGLLRTVRAGAARLR
jgi:hypothetical protein